MGIIGASVVVVVLAAQPSADARIGVTLWCAPEAKSATVGSLVRVLRAMPAVGVVNAEVVPGQATTLTAVMRVGGQVRWAHTDAVFAAFELAGVSRITVPAPRPRR